MKKIATITLQYPYNYGSALQAYALQTYLNKQNVRVTIINYIQQFDFQNYRIFRFPLYRKRPQALLADLLYLNKNLRRKRNFKKFSKRFLNLTKTRYKHPGQLSELNDQFDGFICGSDQIWNFDCTNGADPAYFLDFVNSTKVKASYAPSLAQLDFRSRDSNTVRDFLDDFNAISIREESTRTEFEKLFGVKDVAITLDPTMLLDVEDYENLIVGATEKVPASKYIFVYMLEENLELLNYAKELAQKEGLNIIYISNISKKGQLIMRHYTNAFGISPEDFLHYLSRATYVVTNSFHATVFSVLYSRLFATFMTTKSSVRMSDLLKKLGLEDRCPEDSRFDIHNEIDYAKTMQRLKEIRKPSVNYLHGILQML